MRMLKIDNKFLLKTQNTILSAAFVLFLSGAINSFLGFIKSRLLTNYFGVSTDLAIFYTADRIPNLIYSVLVVGALSTIFIPIFTSELKKSREKAFETASVIMNVTLGFFVLLALVIYIFSPQIIRLLLIGQFGETEIQLGVNLMRIMLLAQMILVAGSLLTSVLQSFKYFLLPALAPVLYNIGMIFGIFLLSERYGIYAPAYGVLIGSVLHFTIQIPAVIKTGFRFKLALNFNDKGLRDMMALVPPRIVSVFIANLIGTINNSLAILISAPSVIYLKFALQLQGFPVLLFGASIASASLPTLSSESDTDNIDKFKNTLVTSLHQMMYLVVPTSVMLLVLRIPIVRIVYGVSNFPWEATIATAQVLALFSLSIFSQSANYLLTRAFYALKDTLTPVKVSLVTIVINVLISLVMIVQLKLPVWSVAFAFSLTSILDCLILLILLSKKLGGIDSQKLLMPFVKISVSAILMGITLYIPIKLLDQVVFDTTRTINLVLLTGVATVSGMATYLFFTWIFRVEEVQLFYKLIKKLNITKAPKPGLLIDEKLEQ